jgi:HSP20 family protein
MKTNRYYPSISEFAQFAHAVDRMFSPYDYARNGGSQKGEDGKQAVAARSLPLDVWADEDSFTLQAYLPGVNPDDVEITMEGEELTIRGQFPQLDEERKFIKRELFHGSFERRLTVNVPVDAERITAEFANGVLTVTVPKAEAVKPKQIKVVAK